MDGYELKRRDFLKKLGLIVGATAVSTSAFSGVANVIAEDKVNYKLTTEQYDFMVVYERWLDAFHEMAKFQKINPDHLDNNKKLMQLSEEAQKYQKDLIEYMKDENFARYYMIVTERVTTTI